MIPTSLKSIAAALLAPGKGILAADESTPTIGKRFAAINLASTETSRRDYRELLFTTSGLSQFISGVILYDETLRQRTKAGMAMPEVLSAQGIVPGIKVDEGAMPLPFFAEEKITQGLDGLRERLAAYRQSGAAFTKWRAVIGIGAGTPSATCLTANAGALALFAALSQEAGLVPIVEPEVLMDGDHTLARSEEVTRRTLETVFHALSAHRVALDGMLLKSGMVVAGSACAQQASPEQVAEATRRCFLQTVPAAVPGIVFLSGGQSPEESTLHLNAICRAGPAPWKFTFSYGRALQDPVIKSWGGAAANVAPAQAALRHRAQCNSFAAEGKYTAALEAGN